jgi:hypothetical protein
LAPSGAEWRRRWRSWLAIAILISVVGGLVLAAAAAGRRTESAFPQFVAAHGFDEVVYANRTVPKLATLPEVTSATELVIPDIGNASCRCTHPISQSGFSVVVAPPKGRSPFTLVSGRLPDAAAPDQVLASFTLQQDYGVQVGTVIHVPFEAPSQGAAYNNPNVALPKPRGPTVAFHVVGIAATEDEFPAGTTPSYALFTTDAFARNVLPGTAVQYRYFVRVRHGAAGLPRFDASAKSLKLGTGTVGASSEDGQAAAVEASIRPQALGWWVLAALAGLVGLAVVGQALGRQSIVESEDYPTMAALGVDRRQLVALGTVRNLVVGLTGAAGAVAIAVALSPIAPLGEARFAETSAITSTRPGHRPKVGSPEGCEAPRALRPCLVLVNAKKLPQPKVQASSDFSGVSSRESVTRWKIERSVCLLPCTGTWSVGPLGVGCRMASCPGSHIQRRGHSQPGIAPICRSNPSPFSSPRSSTTLPSSIR